MVRELAAFSHSLGRGPRYRIYFCFLLDAIRERINKPFYEREDTPEDGVQWKAIVGKAIWSLEACHFSE
jgi:hypothetical protein